MANSNIPSKISGKNPSSAVVEAKKKTSLNPEVQQESNRCITQSIPLLWGQDLELGCTKKIWLGLFVPPATKCKEKLNHLNSGKGQGVQQNAL